MSDCREMGLEEQGIEQRAGSRSFWAGGLRIVLPWIPVLLWLGCIYLVGQTRAFPLRGHEDIVRLIVRKGVHVGEYAVLVALLYGALIGWRRRFRISLAVLAGALSVAVGVGDEWRQGFIPFRSALAMDIGLDALGVVLGQAFTWFWVTFKRF